MDDLEIVDPRRSYDVGFDADRPWILPEPWKTPGSAEIDRIVIAAFPTAPWTGCTRPQAPQPRLLLASLKAKVMYDSPHWTR